MTCPGRAEWIKPFGPFTTSSTASTVGTQENTTSHCCADLGG